MEDAAADFTADTGVKVSLVQKEFGEIRDQFVQQVPTGKGPDVIVGAHDWLGVLVENGVAAPVELGDRAGEFEQVALDAFSYNGQVYGVPYAIENIGLLRNTDLVAEAPTDFDDMIAKGEAAGTEYAFLVGLDPEAADPYHLYPFQTSFGAPSSARTPTAATTRTTCRSATTAARSSPDGSPSRARPVSSTPTSPVTSPRRTSIRARHRSSSPDRGTRRRPSKRA